MKSQTRATLIKRMTTELRASGVRGEVKMAACELMDRADRPYGRQYDELGYNDSRSKRNRFFSDLKKSVNEVF